MDNEATSLFLINNHNNDRGPPFEMLSNIFSYLASDGPLQLRHILFVARSWHDAAVYSPNLWTTILIDREFYSRFRDDTLTHGEAFIRCCFIRSRDLPIIINVQYQDRGIGLTHTNEAFSSTVIGRLLGTIEHCHTKRCKALTWTCGDPDMDSYALYKIFPSQLDMLEYLCLQDFVPFGLMELDIPSVLHFPRCPNLKEVSLKNHCEIGLPIFFRNEDLERVEKLTFVNTSTWRPFDLLCISRYHNIDTLTLQDKGGSMTDDQIYEYQIAAGDNLAHLPRLKALITIGCIPNCILESIGAPGLMSLRLETDEDAHHTLATIPTTLLTTLHSIDISLKPLPTSSWVPLLHQVVGEAPCLSHLFIAGWMKDGLEAEDWYRQLNVTIHCV